MPETLAGRFLHWDGFPFSFQEGGGERPWHIARSLRDQWEATCHETIKTGRVAELHAARGDILAVFDRHLAFLKEYVALLDLTERMTDRNGPVRHVHEQTAREIMELTQLQSEIFPKWQTLDDLAEMLIERIPLTEERLQALAAAYPPPQSWYDEDFDPFSPDTPE